MRGVWVLGLTVFVARVAVAEVALPGFDAFLSSRRRVEVELQRLSPAARELVEQGRISSTEARLGVPTFFWAGRGKGLLGSGRLTAEQAARRYLLSYAELYRTPGASLAESRLHRLHHTGTGAIVASFVRDVAGVRIFNDELKVVMNQELELIALTGYLTPARKLLGDFDLGSEQAIDLGFQQLASAALDPQRLKRLPNDEAGFERFELLGQPTPVRIRRVYYPMPEGLVPAWHLELELSAEGSTRSDYYSFVFSARDGALLFRKNLTAQDFSYRVWADATGLKAPFDGPHGNAPTPHPQGTNNMYTAPFVTPNLVTLNHGAISTNDPWLAANATTTDGNNTVAYADFNSPNGFSNGDLKASTTAPGVFDRTYDVGLSPNASADQRMAAVTQLFYNVNFFHDWFYDVGFDEKSGNAQANNFGRGGAGGDALFAEAEDYSGTNNANMSTPSDGAHPRMQMYVFTSGTPATVAIQGGPTYRGGAADFGPQSFTLTQELVLADDGDPAGGTVTDGCQPNWNAVAGKIAVVDRGGCTFAEKAINAQANAAVGLLILNNSFGGAIPLPGTAPSVNIPVLSTGRNDGNALKARIQAGVTRGTMSRTASLDRDGTIDNAIVAHEWGHYISNRLIGDGNGIANNQGVGMGEGWGDFHAMLMVVKGEDALVSSNANFNGTYGLAAYTTALTDPNGFYWGIRRMPYSTDLAKNPLTFKHIQDGVALPASVPMAFGQNGRDNSEVHNTGEVWATMLWECYAALLRDSARLTFEQSRDRMRAYLVAAYKTTPFMPTFVEARDALLAAAVANDGTDFALFSAAFAKRGLGMLAVAPDRDSADNKPVTESFITGNAFVVTKLSLDDSVSSCDRDGLLDDGEVGKLTVTVKNVGVGLLSSTAGTVRSTTAGVTVRGNGALTFDPVMPFATQTASVEVSFKGMGVTAANFEVELSDPTTAVPGPQRARTQFRLNFDAQPSGASSDDVEAPMTPWVFGNDPRGATGSDFRRYEDSGTAHWFFGPDPDSPADTYLVSPPLQVGTGPFTFSFSHRFQFEGDAQEYFDGAVVEVSTDDGRSWSDLGPKLSQPYNGRIANNSSNPLRGRSVYSGESANYPAWSTVSVDLGTAYAGQTAKIRFRIGSDDALGLKGWEIDDLQFVGLTNRPFPAVASDPNLCSNRPPVISVPPTLFVNEGAVVKLHATAMDPDGEALILRFTQVFGPLVTLQGGDTFTAPEVEVDTAIDFEVVASDGRASSAPVIQRVMVRNMNKTPVARLQAELVDVNERAAVSLTATAVDPEGDPITGMRWVQTSGPAVSLTGAQSETLQFTAPEVGMDTVLTFEVYARDATSEGAAAVATVVVHNLFEDPPVMPKGGSRCGCQADGQALASLMGVLVFALARRRRSARH